MSAKGNSMAWRNGIGAVIMAICSLVPWTSFSLYVRPISNSLGVEVGSVSLIFSLSAVGGLVTSLLIGKLLKKVNPKIVVACGGAFLLILLVTVSVSNSVVPLYVAALFHGFGGVAAGFTMAQIAITQWFEKARGTMLSVISIGLSVAGAIFFPILGTLIESYGYRTVALWEGIIAGGLVILTGIFFISDPPEKYGLKPYGYVEKSPVTTGNQTQPAASLMFGQIMKIPAFWIIILCTLLATMAAQSFNSQGASFFQSIGLDAVQASLALSVFSLAGMAWSLLFGVVSDKASPTIATLINGGVGAIAYILAFLWVGWAGAIIAAICFAAAGTVSGILGPTLAARLFGTREAGSMVGFIRAGSSIGAMLGPPIAGFLFDSTKSYSIYFAVMGVGLVVVIILTMWVGSKKTVAKIQKIKENQAQVNAKATQDA